MEDPFRWISYPLASPWDSIFSWFQQVDCYPKLLWKGRESSTVYFCLGIGQYQPHLPTVFTVRAFDTTQPQWEGFPEVLKWTPFGIIEWRPDTNRINVLLQIYIPQWVIHRGHIQTHRNITQTVQTGQRTSTHQNNCFTTRRFENGIR